MKTGSTTILTKAFDRLDKNALDALRTVARRRLHAAGTILCRQGDVEHKFYVIVEGLVLCNQELEDGQKRTIGTLGANEYFGEMSLLDDTPRMFTYKTLSETTVLEITEEIFEQLVHQSPAVAYSVTRNILANLRRIDELAIGNLRDKNLALQEAYAELKQAQADLVEKERLERELELAAELQRSLLPAGFPSRPGYRFAGYLEPARKVGGDLYDLIEIDDEHIGLLVADVADKGVHAALFMAVTRTLFYMEGRRQLSPAKVAMEVHRGMLEIAPAFDVFVTAFYGVLHLPSGKFTYVRAGHEAPYLLRRDKKPLPLPGHGRFLGMWEELQLKNYRMQLEAGDRLVLYSDGVTDAMNPEEQAFGYEGLEKVLIPGRSLSADSLVEKVVEATAAWRGTADAFDDQTLLVVEVL